MSSVHVPVGGRYNWLYEKIAELKKSSVGSSAALIEAGHQLNNSMKDPLPRIQVENIVRQVERTK